VQNPFAGKRPEHGEVELLRGLVKLAKQLQANLDMGAVVRAIATAIAETLGFREATVYVREPGADEFRAYAAVGCDRELNRRTLSTPVPAELFARLFQPRFQISRSYFIDHRDYTWDAADAAYFPTVDLGPRHRGEWHTDDSLFVPIYDKADALMGVLDLGDPEDRTLPSPDRIGTLEVFSTHAAVAIENARQYRQLEAATHELAGALRLRHDLMELSEALLATLDQKTVFEQIAVTLKALVDYDTIDISLVDETAGELVTIFARDQFAEEVMEFRVPLDKGVSGWVVRHNEAQLVNDMDADPRGVIVPGTDAEPQASIFVPLQILGKVSGVLIIDRLGRRHFEQREFEVAKLFGNFAAIAIQNARSFNEMEVQAISDGLTGIHNYRHFRETLESTTSRAARYDETFCLLMMDLDHFKQVNDTVGHQQGDVVLRAVADALRHCSRDSDYQARYGGEEFVMILPQTSREEAQRMAERVRAQVREIDAGVPGLRVSMSIGVASYPQSSRDADGVLRAADAALLQAKAHGRDRVHVYDDDDKASSTLDTQLIALSRRFAERIGLSAEETAGLVTALAAYEFAAHMGDEVAAILGRRRRDIDVNLSNDPGALAGAQSRTYEALLYGNERWDGAGYPEGLRGAAIPRVARAFAVCRSWGDGAGISGGGGGENGAGTARVRAGTTGALDPALAQRFLAVVRETEARNN
jgi:diguanylate cyclase (GGDEF)-like protein